MMTVYGVFIGGQVPGFYFIPQVQPSQWLYLKNVKKDGLKYYCNCCILCLNILRSVYHAVDYGLCKQIIDSRF